MSNRRATETSQGEPIPGGEGAAWLAALWILGVVVTFVYQLLAALGG